jgi:hypothetical protein
MAPVRGTEQWQQASETLVALGAPLAGVEPRASLDAEHALRLALVRARVDAALLRCLPVVLARCWRTLDWQRLETQARVDGTVETLGMLLELTGDLAGAPLLKERAARLWSQRGPLEFFFPPKNQFDEELARERTPSFARRWGFLLNMGEDSFRGLFERHLAV